MARGKQTCKILKEIRRQIAEVNGIEFATSECRYKGDCLGTCPKCKAEVRYLEQQLRARSLAGKAVSLAGISAASLAMLMPMQLGAQELTDSSANKVCVPAVTADSIIVKGIVLSGDTLPDGTISKEPLIGATIINHRTEKGTVSNIEGEFELSASPGDTLEVHYIGYDKQKITVTGDMSDITITLLPDTSTLMGEYVVVSDAIREENHYLDLHVVDEQGNKIDRDNLSIERIWIDEDGDEDYELISPEYFDDGRPCRIYWDYDYGLKDENGKPLKEATLSIVADGYDDPIIIKVKYPKRSAKRTIKFKHKKK